MASNSENRASVKHYHLLRPVTLRSQPVKFNTLLQNEKNKDQSREGLRTNSDILSFLIFFFFEGEGGGSFSFV